MKCLDDETLSHYAYDLTDETEASQVRAHLGECPRCRVFVEQHERLDAVLDEWKFADPTPGFDARVRQAVEAAQARRERWGLWGLGWARALAAASVVVLVAAGSIWFAQRHHRSAHPPEVAARQPQQAPEQRVPGPSAKVQKPSLTAHAGRRPAEIAHQGAVASDISSDDQDDLGIEDYDVAANFDLLSEMPKTEPRSGN